MDFNQTIWTGFVLIITNCSYVESHDWPWRPDNTTNIPISSPHHISSPYRTTYISEISLNRYKLPLTMAEATTPPEQSYSLDDSVPAGPGMSSFPTTEADLRSDPRVAFSRLSGKWTLEADDGSEYEYDGALRRWIPVVCIPLVFHHRSAV